MEIITMFFPQILGALRAVFEFMQNSTRSNHYVDLI